jgi:hypothetical protein
MYITQKDFDVDEISLEISNEYIKDFSRNNFEVNDVFSEAEILDYVEHNYQIDKVFSKSEIEQWCKENGYVKR